MRKSLSLAVTIGSVLAAIPGLAQDSTPDYARPGPYLGVGVAIASFTDLEQSAEDALLDLGYVFDVTVDTGVGADIRGGYRISRYAAIEAEFEILPSIDASIPGTRFAEIDFFALTANAKFFPITGRIQPFALVGLGVLHGEVKDTLGFDISDTVADLAFRVGGGLDVYITEHVALTAGVTYLRGTGDVSDSSYISTSIGAQYRF